MAQMSFYRFRHLILKSTVPILGATKLQQTPKNYNLEVVLCRKYPRRSTRIHHFEKADCFQKRNRFYVRFKKNLTTFEKSYILTHDLLPHILAAQGCFIFHGSLIQNRKRNFLILGKSGAGKSSLGLRAVENKGHCWGDEASLVYRHKRQWYVTPVFLTIRHWPQKKEKASNRFFGKELTVISGKPPIRKLDKVVVLKKKSPKKKLRILKGEGVPILQELLTHVFWPDNISPEKRRQLFDDLSDFSTSISPQIVEYPHRPPNQTFVLQKLLEFKKIG